MIDNINIGDKIVVTKKFNFADRFYSEVGDIWTVYTRNDNFTGIKRNDMNFRLNNSSIDRHFKCVE